MHIRLKFSKCNNPRKSGGQFQFINIRNQLGSERTMDVVEKRDQTSEINKVVFEKCINF